MPQSLRVAVVAALSLPLMPTTPANSAVSPCASNAPAASIEAAGTVATGRPLIVRLVRAPTEATPYQGRITFTAATGPSILPGSPTREVLIGDSSGADPFSTAGILGDITLVATWVEQTVAGWDATGHPFVNECTRVATQQVTVLPGRGATLAAAIVPDLGLDVWGRDVAAVSQGCSLAAIETLRISVRSGRQEASASVGDLCAWQSFSSELGDSPTANFSGKRTGTRFRLKVDGRGRVEIRPTSRTPGIYPVRWSASIGSSTRNETLWIKVRRRPAETIYIGTDDFVNVCINQDRTIRSRNGRLYCHLPRQLIYSVTTSRPRR